MQNDEQGEPGIEDDGNIHDIEVSISALVSHAMPLNSVLQR